MSKTILKAEREFERDYQIKGGRIITIIFDEENESFNFKENGEIIGDKFRFIDYSVDGNRKRFLIARMYSPIKLAGLGRAVLEFFIYLTEATIYAHQNEGIKKDDGSHLTEDALNFVSKMQKAGLIEKYSL